MSFEYCLLILCKSIRLFNVPSVVADQPNLKQIVIFTERTFSSYKALVLELEA